MTPELQTSLRKAVVPFVAEKDFGGRLEAAMTLAVEGAELSPVVERALNSFLEQANEVNLRALQTAVISSGEVGIGAEPFVDLAVALIVHNLIEAGQAATALASLPYTTRAALSPEQEHIVQVADAVVEDAREGLLDVVDDNLLTEAARTCWASRSERETC